jgi:hypothetical protein
MDALYEAEHRIQLLQQHSFTEPLAPPTTIQPAYKHDPSTTLNNSHSNTATTNHKHNHTHKHMHTCGGGDRVGREAVVPGVALGVALPPLDRVEAGGHLVVMW